MEKMCIIKATGLVLGGVVIGVLGSRQHFKTKYEQLMEEELESMRELHERKRGTRTKHVVEHLDIDIEVPEDEDRHDTHEVEGESSATVTTIYSGKNDTIVESHKVKSMKKDALQVYIISMDEFAGSYLHHDKHSIEYYEQDDTLLDVDHEIATDVKRMLGTRDANSIFGTNPDDPDVAYVRNTLLGVDYEVVRIHDAFGDEENE